MTSTRRTFLIGADSGALGPVLELEHALVVAYGQVLMTGVLPRHAHSVVHAIYEHELAHVRALGGRVHRGRAAVAAATKLLSARNVTPALTDLHDERDCLRLLLAAEQAALGAYFKAMSQFRSARLLTLAAEIMASEAQHATLLSELLHPGDISRAVPVPFVQGTG